MASHAVPAELRDMVDRVQFVLSQMHAPATDIVFSETWTRVCVEMAIRTEAAHFGISETDPNRMTKINAKLAGYGFASMKQLLQARQAEKALALVA
jgi:hypothetical protein